MCCIFQICEAVEGLNQLFVANDVRWKIEAGTADGDMMHSGDPGKVLGRREPQNANYRPFAPWLGVTLRVRTGSDLLQRNTCVHRRPLEHRSDGLRFPRRQLCGPWRGRVHEYA